MYVEAKFTRLRDACSLCDEWFLALNYFYYTLEECLHQKLNCTENG